MFDLKVIEAGLRAAEKAIKIVDNFTDVEQQEARTALKAAKKALKKEAIAKQIFDGCKDTAIFGDNSFDGVDILFPRDKEENKNYWKLRDKFNKV